MQLTLPLSVGIEIAHHGAAPTWEAAAENLCSVVYPHATSSDSVPPAPHHKKDGSGPSPAGGCPLCAALGVMHAFTDTPTLALPLPAPAESNRPVTAHDDAVAAVPFTIYRSRAPPTVA